MLGLEIEQQKAMCHEPVENMGERAGLSHRRRQTRFSIVT